jgi:hypothetical protein
MPRGRISKQTPERLAQLRSLAAQQCNASEIARQLGLSSRTVLDWAAAHDIKLISRADNQRRRWADPAIRQSMTDAITTAMREPERQRRTRHLHKKLWANPDWARATSLKISQGLRRSMRDKIKLVPWWVPKELRKKYVRLSQLYSEPYAATYCRRLMQQKKAESKKHVRSKNHSRSAGHGQDDDAPQHSG